MIRSDFGSALVSGAQKSGALELVGYSICLFTLRSYITVYRVSGHNGQVFDGNFPSLGERCVKTEAM